MTAPERAVYLIENLGHIKAEAHALWVFNEAVKPETKQYWCEVALAVKVATKIHEAAMLSRILSTPIVECKK